MAAVFAIHPLRVESVAWVAERKDVLSGVFFMLTMGAYVRYARHPNSPIRYGLVALAVCAGPVVQADGGDTAVCAACCWTTGLCDGRRRRDGYCWRNCRCSRFPPPRVPPQLGPERCHSIGGSFTLAHRLANALTTCAIYLRQMIWPDGLAVFYPYQHQGLPTWEVILSGAFVAGLSAVAVARRRKEPWLLVGWCWYLVMLLPVLGIIQVGRQAHADRYTYLPQIGIYLSITWLVAERDWPGSDGTLMAAVVAVLMVCAWWQTAYWKNSETLWKHTLVCTTENDTAENNLGTYLLAAGKVDDAITHFQAALKSNQTTLIRITVWERLF